MQQNTRIYKLNLIAEPFQRFFKTQASTGIILIVVTVIALVWANSPWSHAYHHILEYPLRLGIGDRELEMSLHHFINDGLMSIFFFVVGLEIKREILAGELNSLKQAALPVAAAIGGMLVPALTFVLLNQGDGEKGWGIPMATDIAFSLGILMMLGERVPLALKVMLAAFAIVDDIGAVLVIALYYSEGVNWSDLYMAGGFYLIAILFNFFNVRISGLYLLIGAVIWYQMARAGIHPTLAGVIMAFAIPATRSMRISKFVRQIKKGLRVFVEANPDKHETKVLSKDQISAIDMMEEASDKVQSTLQQLENELHPWVSFAIMPIFALANAGVEVVGDAASFHPLSFYVAASMVLGKFIGITGFIWLAVKLRLGQLPVGIRWSHIMGIAFLGGIGFTMALFISSLAYEGELFENASKIGILFGSMIAALTGFIILKRTLPKLDKSVKAKMREESM